jgi:Na+/proline symporter
VFDLVVDSVRVLDVRLCIDPDAPDWAQASASNVVSLGAIVGTTALYSTTGGLRAVVDTDVVQLAIAMLATALYAVVVVNAAGGLAALPDRLAALYGPARAAEITSFVPESLGALALAAISLQWLAQTGSDGSGYLAQRAMACRSEEQARSSTVWFVVVQILLRSLLWLPIAIALLVLFPVADGELLAVRERTYVEGFVAHLPAGALGLMAVGMLGALASTLDTHLNWGASYWTHDIYDRLLCRGWRGITPSGRALVWVARGSTLALLVLAILLMGFITSIRDAWTTGMLLGAGVGIPLVARWLWWRVTALTELSAIASALVLSPVLAYTIDDESARVLVMAALSVVLTLATAAANRHGPDAACIEFYRRVRPPGWWGPAARACGDDPRLALVRLGKGAVWSGAIALAVFCALAGVGSLLVGSPAPAFFPWRTAWIVVNLLLAFAIPLALWRLRR